MKTKHSSLSPNDSLKLIQTLIDDGISGDRFGKQLRKKKIPHLSFSQIAAVKFCHRRYYLDYIKLVNLKSEPHYFRMGRLIHQFIASSYRNMTRNRMVDTSKYFSTIRQHYYRGKRRIYLENAVQVHLDNIWQDHDILGVEQPFVLQVDNKLPPVVGVVDLILQKDNRIIIVDHKTGGDFYKPDRLQMAIYHRFAKQKYPRNEIRIYYDQYRWVNNLERIRKPALLRTRINLSDSSWNIALKKIRSNYKTIKKISDEDYGSRSGECFRCPFQEVCW